MLEMRSLGKGPQDLERGLRAERQMEPGVVVIPEPTPERPLQSETGYVGAEVVELDVVGLMGPLHTFIQARGPRGNEAGGRPQPGAHLREGVGLHRPRGVFAPAVYKLVKMLSLSV